MLNLLIAVISDRFDSVYEQALSSDYQEKCQLLTEYLDLVQIISYPIQMFKEEEPEEVYYLHIIRYE